MTSVESVSIQPIDKTTVNQICSGQVVLNLATAVKELLENSIDAGADSIQVRLEEYGSESVEVIDNGCGVEEVNYQALTLKHHTSKIKEFSDLYSVETFGFRGEALSSLCSLSDVTITTQHRNSEIGAVLKFDHNGIITSTVKALRKTGTTVKLENLFNPLPIRRTEFLKNLKREYSKMCNVLYAYGLQSKGVRITCTNQLLKSKHTAKEVEGESKKRCSSTTVMDAKGDSLESNIVSIFGVKQKQSLLKISEKIPSLETLSDFNLERRNLDLHKFKLEGYISSCAHGCGRAGSDRQFYFVNSRPIDNQKISKLVNDIYHQYNNRQDPFVVLNIKVECGSFDMNLTPDKRQILIQNEKLLFAVLKESLNAVFENIPSTMEVQNLGLTKEISGGEMSEVQEKPGKFEGLWKVCSSRDSSGEDEKGLKATHSGRGVLSKFRLSSKTPENVPASSERHTLFEGRPKYSQSKIQFNGVSTSCSKKPKIESGFLREENGVSEDARGASNECLSKPFKVHCEPVVMDSCKCNEWKRKLEEKAEEEVDDREKDFESKRMRIDEGLAEEEKKKRKTVVCNVTLSEVKDKFFKAAEKSMKNEEELEVKFLAEIKPQNNERAESELRKELKKESFVEMEVLGQFNLGFIITKLAFDLFIIDQHASDEKYNYETLRATTVIQTQRLINPERLQLTADKEELMLQHGHVFKENGFDFEFDDEAPATSRIKLTSVPMSKNYVFGKDDVDELLFLLEDALEVRNLRPSRINSMFASRACRKSVMIGTALNHQEMRRIVDHMGEMQQPWNCPHGRPTMRHLVNLNMIHSQEQQHKCSSRLMTALN